MRRVKGNQELEDYIHSKKCDIARVAQLLGCWCGIHGARVSALQDKVFVDFEIRAH